MTLHRILREPLVHFFVLGGLLFGLYGWVHEDAADTPDEIVVDGFRVDALRSQYERLWRRPPTDVELKGMIDAWVREEILYREGLALGLDRDDPVLKRRVAQKMTFMVDELDAEPPTDDELEAWLDTHADDYRIESTYSFRQVYFDPGKHAGTLADALDRVRAALAGGTDAATAGDSTLLPASMSQASASNVKNSFGNDFAEALTGVAPGSWTGPVPSAYGVHLVYVEHSTPARIPSLDEVRAAVARDVDVAKREAADDAFYAALRERYTVRFGDEVSVAANGADASAGASP